MSNRVLWSPSAERAEATNLRRFQTFVADRHGVDVSTFQRLHAWSAAEAGDFWADVWDFGGVRGDMGSRLIEPAAEFRHVRFLPDATLNVAENLLRDPSDDPALVFRGEDGERLSLTRAELHDVVSRIQQLLTEAGVSVGDRVAAWLPNRPETYAVMLAAASLGAVFSSTSPDFGVDGVVDRFGQIEPKVLFSAEGYHYNGVHHDCTGRLAAITDRLPTLERSVVVGGDCLQMGKSDVHVPQRDAQRAGDLGRGEWPYRLDAVPDQRKNRLVLGRRAGRSRQDRRLRLER